MKLELKHLAAYLPYGLQGISVEENLGIEFVKGYSTYGKDNKICLTTNVDDIDIEMFQPILRPLSDLTKEITVNGQTFVPIEWLEEKYYTLDLHEQAKRLIEELDWLNQTEYMLVDYLHEWHFDTFGLIDAGLAVDINTIKTTQS